jgi:hypothetical protein
MIVLLVSTAAAESPWESEQRWWESLTRRQQMGFAFDSPASRDLSPWHRRERGRMVQQWQIDNADPKTKLGPFMTSFLRGMPGMGPNGEPPPVRGVSPEAIPNWRDAPLIGSPGGWLDENGKLHTSGQPPRIERPATRALPDRRQAKAKPARTSPRRRLSAAEIKRNRIARAAAERIASKVADRRPSHGLLADSVKELEERRRRSMMEDNAPPAPKFVHRGLILRAHR